MYSSEHCAKVMFLDVFYHDRMKQTTNLPYQIDSFPSKVGQKLHSVKSLSSTTTVEEFVWKSQSFPK